MSEISVNRCDKCKFWRSVEDDKKFYQETDNYGEVEGFGTCQKVWHYVGHKEREASNAKAVVVDGSGFFAALKTKADFGCNGFESHDGTSEPAAEPTIEIVFYGGPMDQIERRLDLKDFESGVLLRVGMEMPVGGSQFSTAVTYQYHWYRKTLGFYNHMPIYMFVRTGSFPDL